LNSKLKKRLRTIGHKLKAIVTIANNGLSDNVLAELNRALEDHELIKVKILGSRNHRTKLIEVLNAIENTEVIQVVGAIALVHRPSRQPNLSLSNIARAESI
tara:strand:+ start:199 stop:504 length:306 start_codon:yes stop_codon:yes gene_type:complete